jgi:hypothetical protein
MLAACLLVALVGWAIRSSPTPARTAGAALGGLAAIALVLGGISAIDHGAHSDHDHDHEPRAELALAAVDPGRPADPGLPADPGAREAWYRARADDGAALLAALPGEGDPSLRLVIAAALARAARPEGLRELAALAASDVPFLRLEACARLRTLAGDAAPAYDPLAGPDAAGVWAAWAAAPPAGWTARAAEVALP